MRTYGTKCQRDLRGILEDMTGAYAATQYATPTDMLVHPALISGLSLRKVAKSIPVDWHVSPDLGVKCLEQPPVVAVVVEDDFSWLVF